MQHGARRQHFGVEQRAPAQQSMEEPAVPVSPVHHWGDAEAAAHRFTRFSVIFQCVSFSFRHSAVGHFSRFSARFLPFPASVDACYDSAEMS
jgi:hypothetical protein